MPAPSSRNASFDHIRVLLTLLVILHHTAIVYGGSGGWYWREEPNGSRPLLILFNAVNQSYFMGFFFLLAGYYTPASFDRKGPARYLLDRFLRLGLPLIGYTFVLSPMTIALARTGGGHPFWSDWWLMIRTGQFEPGPLWFAEALLIFALAYTAWRALRREPPLGWSEWPSPAALTLGAAIAAAVAFLIRLQLPVGRNILWLQLGYFPVYVLLFIAGCRTARARLLERVSLAQARPWAVVSAVLFVVMPVMILTRAEQGDFSGGWNLNALFYAFWDPFMAWGIILMMLWFFNTRRARGNRPAALLARSAYGAYIVHPPVLVGLSVAAQSWTAPALMKFAVIGAGACVASFAAAALLVALPGVRRVV